MNNTSNQQIKNRTMPDCTIIPVLGYKSVTEAIDWLCKTFGFRERWRAGNHRAQLIYEGGVIALTEQPDSQKENQDGHLSFPRQSLILQVKDINKHYEHACKSGAVILQPPTDYPYGERQYSTEDIGGHQWTFSQSVMDVAPEDWGGTTAKTN